MKRRRIDLASGRSALSLFLAGEQDQLAVSVRFLLEELATLHPGTAVEVRVPPLGAVQCVEGPSHSRGTPANVVEISPDAWIELATGRASFDSLVASGKISASGTRSNIGDLFPIFIA